MLIHSQVCAEFHDRSGKTVFTITPDKLLEFMDAPEAIREDPLFDMMLRDGSLSAVESLSQQRALEADPKAGTTAEGKKPAKTRGKASADADPAADSDQPAADPTPETTGKKSDPSGKKAETADPNPEAAGKKSETSGKKSEAADPAATK